ncbi:MAG: hypothetical protein ACFFD4_38685 [Candidatus Odinarchaeota archaeon]
MSKPLDASPVNLLTIIMLLLVADPGSKTITSNAKVASTFSVGDSSVNLMYSSGRETPTG